MLAKVIAHAETRKSALTKLRTALFSFEIAGVTTNIPFLVRLLAEEAVIANEVDTGFIERERAGGGGLRIRRPFIRPPPLRPSFTAKRKSSAATPLIPTRPGRKASRGRCSGLEND